MKGHDMRQYGAAMLTDESNGGTMTWAQKKRSSDHQPKQNVIDYQARPFGFAYILDC